MPTGEHGQRAARSETAAAGVADTSDEGLVVPEGVDSGDDRQDTGPGAVSRKGD